MLKGLTRITWPTAVLLGPCVVADAQEPPSMPPGLRERYTQAQLSEATLAFSVMPVCNVRVPGFQERTKSTYQAWRRKHEDLIAYFEMTAPQPVPAAGDPDPQLRETCGDALAAMERDVLPPNPRFATPEKTWGAFSDALAQGDRTAAIACFASSGSQFATAVEELPVEGLKRLAASFGKLVLTAAASEDFQEAVIETKNGSGHIVEFVKLGSEWKIAQL